MVAWLSGPDGRGFEFPRHPHLTKWAPYWGSGDLVAVPDARRASLGINFNGGRGKLLIDVSAETSPGTPAPTGVSLPSCARVSVNE